MKDIVKTVLGVLLSIVLVFVIIFEVKFFFTTYERASYRKINEMSGMASQIGKEHVTLDTLYTWPTAPQPAKELDVLKIPEADTNVRVSGILTSTEADYSGIYSYIPEGEQTAHRLTVTNKQGMYDSFSTAYASYLKGDANGIADFVGYTLSDTSVVYQQNYADNVLPVIYDESIAQFYLVYPNNDDETVFVINTDLPVEVTKDIATVHYGDPTRDPMLSHTYSDYEIWAANNTLEQMKEGKDKNKTNKDEDVKESYGNSDSEGSGTFTSSIDNKKRETLASYANLTFGEDGVCKTNSDIKLDITGTEAKNSQWTITSTSYSYTYAGLSISSLHAKRDSKLFTLTCNINNNMDAIRPYVVVVKYLNSENKLVGVKVIDKRTDPLASKGVGTITADIYAIEDKCPIETITAVQFDIY